MDNLTVLVVDDEKLARQKICRFLNEIDPDCLVEEASNGLEALEKMPKLKPKMVFLDIQMPGLTGFGVLQQLEQRDFKLIFQTAYDQYAIKAFEENSCDYLLKPFSKERFEKAYQRALASIAKPDNFQKLEADLQRNENFLSKIAVKQGAKLKLVAVEEILCFVSQDHYTCAYTSRNEYICELSLAHLSDRLSPAEFWRLHRNNIVNISAITSISGGENMSLELVNTMKLPVSRNNRKRIKDLINNF